MASGNPRISGVTASETDPGSHDDAVISSESARVQELLSYEILDTEPEERFDRIARLASRIFDMPIAFISFVTDERQWHKAAVGSDVQEVVPADGYCAYNVESPGAFVVEDAREDPRFADHPLVTDHNLVFYAGAPITTAAGFRIGTLCVLDTEPRRDFDEDDRTSLLELADIVTDELDFRWRTLRLREEAEQRAEAVEELQKREKEFREQHRFIDAILHNIPGVWAVLDKDGAVVRSNSSLARVTGYSEEEIEDEDALSLVAPGDRGTVESALGEAFTGGQAKCEICLRTKDGIQIPYMIHARRYGFEGTAHVVAIGIDISELKSVEAELSEQRDFAEAILETIPGIWNVRNERGEIVRRNPTLTEATGFTGEEVASMSIADFVAPEDREAANAAFEEVLETGATEVQVDLVKKDGTQVPYAYVGRRGMIGGQPHVVTVGIEISELKEAEEELRNRERTFRQLTENIEEAFWVSDVALSEMHYASPAYRTIWGRPVEELYENPLAFLEGVHPADRQRVVASLQDLASGDWQMEYRVLQPDGDVRWVRANAFPVENDAGEVYRVAGIIKDVTAERHAHLSLEAARDAAEAANQAKSGFLSRMSHELRTPLNAILGYSQVLLMDEWEDDTREALSDIENAGRHLLELINEILDISRIEAGQMKLSLEPVDVAEILAEVIVYARPLAAGASIALLPPDPACQTHVMADNQRLKQVLLNLVSNAVKYNVPGGRIDIGCVRRDGVVRIQVSDTGNGLSPENVAKLFQPFERLGLTDEDGEGTGLGLSLSKNLMEVMGGEIGVHSRPGVGSTFWVELPEVESPLERAQDATHAAASVHAGAEQICVLYIEDNVSNLKLLEHVMKRLADVSLQSAYQGSLGIELARSLRPDLILLDMNLPDMEGTDVIAALRDDPDTADIPIVVLSADATPKRIAEVEDVGIHAYMTKPLDVKAFLAMMEEFRQ